MIWTMMMTNHNLIPGQFFLQHGLTFSLALRLEGLRRLAWFAGLGVGPTRPVLRRLIRIPEIPEPWYQHRCQGGRGDT